MLAEKLIYKVYVLVDGSSALLQEPIQSQSTDKLNVVTTG